MKINFKKIIAFTYLITILFGLFLPITIHAAEKWFYIEMDHPYALPVNLTNSTSGASTQEECDKSRTESIKSLYQSYKDGKGDSLITRCFKHEEGTIPKKEYSSLKQPTEKVSDLGKQLDIKPITVKPEDKTGSVTDTVYKPLAPLPDGSSSGDMLTEINTQEECAFGKYLNIIIKLIIGISAVLAMVMITMGGIEYITSELSSEKASGKDTIQNAVLGLVMVMGAYLILNTINPQLLNICLDKLPEAKITIMDEEESMGMTSGKLFEGTTNSCPEGITKIKTTGGEISICKKLNTQGIIKTIDDARKSGINLFGWGYRTTERQIELRKQNCNGNITDPKAKCRPPTAFPGTSRHENGLAIDFTCDGQSIQTKDNKCYLWLVKNSSIHNLMNMRSEAWHWSYDGK